jgi:hypothetical protein
LKVFWHPLFNYSGPDLTLIQQRPNTISSTVFTGLPGNYWSCDHVRSAVLTDYGLAVWVEFGEGDPNYPLQNETLSTTAKMYFGCISKTNIITAIQNAPNSVGTVHVPLPWEDWFAGGFAGSDGGAYNGIWGSVYNPSEGTYGTIDLFVHASWLDGSNAPLPAIIKYDLTPS